MELGEPHSAQGGDYVLGQMEGVVLHRLRPAVPLRVLLQPEFVELLHRELILGDEAPGFGLRQQSRTLPLCLSDAATNGVELLAPLTGRTMEYAKKLGVPVVVLSRSSCDRHRATRR